MTFGEDFGLVQIPIALSPVVKEKADVKTELISPAGAKTVTQKMCPETGEVLEAEDVQRGIKNGDGYVVIPDEDWATITEETKPTEVEVTEFVNPELPVVADRLASAQDAHFVQAQGGAGPSLGVIVGSMVESGKVGIVRFGTGSRQRLGILQVRGDGALVIQTVPFAADIQEPDEEVLAASEAEVSAKAAKLGTQLVKRLSGKGETLETAVDEAVERRKELIEELFAGKKPKKGKAKAKAKASSIEDALEASLA